MKIERETSSYNARRFGKPWIAKITWDGTKTGFEFGHWIGDPGEAGILVLDGIEPGDVYARGQRDFRKPRNSAPSYYVLGADGKMAGQEMTKAEAYRHWQSTHQEVAHDAS